MNSNLNKSTRELLLMANLMLGYLIFILAIGVYTRPTAAASPAPVLASYAISVDDVAGSATSVDGIDNEAVSIGALSINANDILENASSVTISMFESIDEKITIVEHHYEEATRPKTPVEVYCEYVDDIVGNMYPNLDASYIKAIIYHESRFQPNEINKRTNVIGLMQIMPKWHMDRARKLGVEDLTDPYGNILVGCDLLSEITEKYSATYAIDFFAGGYDYANRYRNGSTSPVMNALNRIIESDLIGLLQAQQESAGLYVE